MFIAAHASHKHLPWLIGAFSIALLIGLGVLVS